MSESTLDMLNEHVDSVAETIREYARQIESGEYGRTHDDDGNQLDNFADEPTIVDEYGNETPISEWPLEVVVKVGSPLAVVICTGGPHIEIVHDLSDGQAKLAGYWGGDRIYQHGTEFQTVLDYLTDAEYDAVPDEYK